MNLVVTERTASRLMLGEEVYEILTGRAYKFFVGRTYKLGNVPNTYVKVLSNRIMGVNEIPNSVWRSISPMCSHEEYIHSRCGVPTKKIFVVKLVLAQKFDSMQKAWLRGIIDRGLFVSRNLCKEMKGEVAVAEPYYELCEEYGDWYREFLSDKYNVSLDKLYTIKGWTNRRYTNGFFLPKRVKIVGFRDCLVSEITEEEWNLLGADDTERSKIGIVGKDYWERDFHIRLYRYELVTNNALKDEEW